MRPSKTAKMFLSKEYRTPVSADGIRLRRGTCVFVIWTKDSGKTWHSSPDVIDRTTRRGMVSFDQRPRMWHYAWPIDDMVGDHRIYAIEANAKAECLRRNRAAKNK